ncbi:hypothetical protein TTHERM_00865260 (macronuclear) [Tetrahymena thermophila SB210]|uniref:Uncharacterized protein n=1 Tax=Tetrahymena thermophila (strain SB210) TaxID=312017 RepID=Q24FD7_TETTS|nr:hypothetical protein TTHERM_00865260 [Tetrahymena thermophila SB210]EAS06521.4 hypothetical protein TTHERM_00865260 [Tetrahymena thermophila SB210]|eukprot:XP_001026766.4 hypothetical protein TTHERM_00865260 [Tetrahymena thermophila SB210]
MIFNSHNTPSKLYNFQKKRKKKFFLKDKQKKETPNFSIFLENHLEKRTLSKIQNKFLFNVLFSSIQKYLSSSSEIYYSYGYGSFAPGKQEYTNNSRDYAYFCLELCQQRLKFIQDNQFNLKQQNEFTFVIQNIRNSKIIPIDLTMSQMAQIYQQFAIKNSINQNDSLKNNKDQFKMEFFFQYQFVLKLQKIMNNKQFVLNRFPYFRKTFIDSRNEYMALKIYQTLIQSPPQSKIVCIIGKYHFEPIEFRLSQLIEQSESVQF